MMGAVNKVLAVLLNVLIFTYQIDAAQKQIEIKVDILNGIDSLNCLMTRSRYTSCKTLEYVLKHKKNLNNTDIILLPGLYMLPPGYTRFTRVQNLKITSKDNSVIYCTGIDSGIDVSLSTNITLNGIAIQNCGARYNPSVVYTIDVFTRIGIHFENCINIYILDSEFSNNIGIGVGMINTFGEVKIVSTRFINNSDIDISRKEIGRYVSGGGLYIELSQDADVNTKYTIHNSKFDGNVAENDYNYIFPRITLKDEETYFGKGGGINIDISNGKYDIMINECHFSNNKALWGAAIYASFNGSTDDNTLTIQHSNFMYNNATLAGGGVRLEKYAKHEDAIIGNKILFSFLYFRKNTALWGGGISVSLTTEVNYRAKTYNKNISITKCNFSLNSATVGFAFGAATLNKNLHSVGAATYRVLITDSTFDRNYMILTEDRKVTGQGAIYAEEVSVILNGNNNFTRNNYTALCLDSSKLTFKSSSRSIFDGNIGIEGGAISLYGFSWILLEEHSYVIFKNNVAKRRGGAVYVRNPGPPRIAFQTTKLQIASCFIRYLNDGNPDDWPVTIIFQNNQAPPAAGNSIYATTLKYCRKPGEFRNESSAFKWKPIKYYNNFHGFYEVVTDPMYVLLKESDWNATPDLPFNGNVKLYDEKQQNVYGTLNMQLYGAELDPPNNVFLVRKYIKRLRLLGKVKSNYTFRFFTLSGMTLESPVYKASFKSCKPGFEPDKNNTKCVCMSEESSSVVRCFDNGTVFILKGKWGYLNSENRLNTIDCPEHYCRCHHEYEGYLCKYDKHTQCAHNRTGILCSECPRGWSVQFGNEACQKCENTSLLLLIPGLIILTVFCGLIFYLDIDVFSGHLNAYLYCYQMIDLLIPDNIALDPFISFIIGITSLGGTGGNLGFCLYDGMNNLDKMMINYAIPLYVVVCTLFFGLLLPQRIWEKIFCCRTMPQETEIYAQRQARNHSFGRALSFVLVLCYSSFTTVTLKLLHPVKYNDKYVVFNAGFQDFLNGRHLVYSIIAIVLLFVVVIGFPIILLFTHYFSRRFYTVQKAEPIFNALKSNFHDNMLCRCFAAFYFICRLLLLVIDIFIREEVLRLIILAIASVVIQAIFSAVQPYKKKLFNYYDILQLSNMCLISLLSWILSVPFTPSGKYRESLSIFLKILVYLPLLSATIRLFIMCYRKDSDYGKSIKLLYSLNSFKNIFYKRYKKLLYIFSLGMV